MVPGSQTRCPALPRRARERAPKQPIEFPHRGLPVAAIQTLLPNVGNAQRERLPAEGSWRLLTDLLLPKVPKLRTRQPAEVGEEHTSELQSRRDLVCRLLLEK